MSDERIAHRSSLERFERFERTNRSSLSFFERSERMIAQSLIALERSERSERIAHRGAMSDSLIIRAIGTIVQIAQVLERSVRS